MSLYINSPGEPFAATDGLKQNAVWQDVIRTWHPFALSV